MLNNRVKSFKTVHH